jgi:hypothetical protein
MEGKLAALHSFGLCIKKQKESGFLWQQLSA